MSYLITNMFKKSAYSYHHGAAIVAPDYQMPESNISLGAEDYSDSYSLPEDTVKVLGLLNEEQIKIRAVLAKNLTPLESLKGIVRYFSESEKEILSAPDSNLALELEKRINRANSSIREVNHFSARYFEGIDEYTDSHGASKQLILKAIAEIINGLAIEYKAAKKLMPEVLDRKSRLVEPDISELTTSEQVVVLEGTKEVTGSDRSARPLSMLRHDGVTEVAKILEHQPVFNPHSHLLVDSLSVVNSNGMIEELDTEIVSRVESGGEEKVKLLYEGGAENAKLGAIPNYSLKNAKTITEDASGMAFTEASYLATYHIAEKLPEQDLLSFKTNLCVPEHFAKLYEKLEESCHNDLEKAQLIASAYFAGKLIYDRSPEIEELYNACPAKHRISLALGLGVGDCQTFSAVLQQLFAHGGVKAAIEGGAVCDDKGDNYVHPGHARVKVYCDRVIFPTDIKRFDPTNWTEKSLNFKGLSADILGELVSSLENADAEGAYRIGLKARTYGLYREKKVDDEWADSNLEEEESNGDRQEQKESERRLSGHRLSDDYNQDYKSSLYKILATNSQDILVSECWDLYKRLIAAAKDQDYNYLRCLVKEFFGEENVVRIEVEEGLVGIENSRLCRDLPEMIILLNTEFTFDFVDDFARFFNSFSNYQSSKAVRSAIISRSLSERTVVDCALALQYCEDEQTLSITDESARFLVKLLKLIAQEDGHYGFDAESDDFYSKIIKLAAQFPDNLQVKIFDALKETFIAIEAERTFLVTGNETLRPDDTSRKAISYLYPEYKSNPVEFFNKLAMELDEYGDGCGDVYWKLNVLTTITQYFDKSLAEQIKPIVTESIKFYLKELDLKVANSLENKAYHALGELCVINYLSYKPVQSPFLLLESFLRTKRSPKLKGIEREHQPFIAGYYLQNLVTLGLLDREAIIPYLKNFKASEVRDIFPKIYSSGEDIPTYFFNYACMGLDAAGLSLAAAYVFQNREDDVNPSQVDIAYEAGIIREDYIDLVKTLFRQKKKLNKKEEKLAAAAVPASIVRIIDVEDQLRFKSNVWSSFVLGVIREELVGRDSFIDWENRSAKGASLISDKVFEEIKSRWEGLGVKLLGDKSLVVLYLSEQREEFSRADDSIGIFYKYSLRHLLECTKKTIFTLKKEEILATDLESYRKIVRALIKPSEPEEFSAEQLNFVNVNNKLWKSQLLKSLKSQRQEGSANLLRKLTQQRSENVDSLRAYQAGEDIRTINWKASARLNRLLVNQYNKQQESVADSYHVVLDIADLFMRPEYEYSYEDNDLVFEGEPVNSEMLRAMGNFLASLIQEGKEVRFSLYAMGSEIFGVNFKGDSKHVGYGPIHQALTEVQRYASQYKAFCFRHQLTPDTYTLSGLMNEHEREELVREQRKNGLVINLQGDITTKYPPDKLIAMLQAQGRAARVNLLF